jgi:putative Holliday junction resolvase
MDAVRVLAVDPGGRRFGLAVGDEATGLAGPVAVIASGGVAADARAIAAEVARRDANAVVIGLPTTPDGDDTPACARSRALAEALGKLGITTRLQPEHLTTDEARRRARDAGRPACEPVDDLAAQVILEEHLASRRSARNDGP